jgi:phosphohistidine phosphatase
MLELLLLRHAKSRWDQPGAADHGRDLAPRGLKAARRMGALLRERDLAPDLVLCSTARRAMHTWHLAAAALGADPPVRFDDRLYLAAPERIITVVRERGGETGRLLLVGHDPGMHRLAMRLAVTGDARLREALAAKFPTAGLALLALDLAAWSEFDRQTGELRGFWRPRDLGVAGD